jgi:hypothetical protein
VQAVATAAAVVVCDNEQQHKKMMVDHWQLPRSTLRLF